MIKKIKARKELKARLKELRGIVIKYYELPLNEVDLLKKLVEFFNETSIFSDEGGITVNRQTEKFFPKSYEDLKSIEAHIKNMGRDLFGWNRTIVGEKVTLDNVFLGNIYGLYTLSIRDWLNASKENTLKMPDLNNADVWVTKVIANYQVRPFINSHLVIEKIDKVLEVL